MTAIKLCGLREPEHVELASTLGVEFVGLVFAPRSRRRVTVEEAKRALAPLGPRSTAPVSLVHQGIAPGRWFQRCIAALDQRLEERRPLVVGVFADQPPALVNAIIDAAGLDLVQLSGGEPWETALALKRPAIKVLHVWPEASAQSLLAHYEIGMAAAVLLDTGTRDAAGGTGRPFDWSVAAEFGRRMPYILAGGLNADNVGEAIRIARPWGVDVSSGIERDGRKDPDLIRAFVQVVREADASLRKFEENAL
jgi:phosphoribosylanthranilate isomerase